MTAREKIASLLWKSVPSPDDATAKARTEQLLDAYKAAVLREAVAELSALLAEEHEAGAIVDRLSEIADEAQKQAEGAR